ncbi:hypothetical protein [Micromonospora sp. NPDC023737]|uniref:hypothetical protein n=1 Tax=unclassified Micromonospora TaxID=2617518 RepID=UPI0033FE00D8
MSKLNWTTLRCDYSDPNCPEIAAGGENVHLRGSKSLADVARFPAASFETLKRKIRDGGI